MRRAFRSTLCRFPSARVGSLNNPIDFNRPMLTQKVQRSAVVSLDRRGDLASNRRIVPPGQAKRSASVTHFDRFRFFLIPRHHPQRERTFLIEDGSIQPPDRGTWFTHPCTLDGRREGKPPTVIGRFVRHRLAPFRSRNQQVPNVLLNQLLGTIVSAIAPIGVANTGVQRLW